MITVATLPSSLKFLKKFERIVILPEFQGLGIALKAAETVLDTYYKRGYKVHVRGAHKKIIGAFARRKNWLMIDKGSYRNETQNPDFASLNNTKVRFLQTFKYVSNEYLEKPHINVYVKGTQERRKIILTQLQDFYNKYNNTHFITVFTDVQAKTIHTNTIEQYCLNKGIQQDTVLSRGKIKSEKIALCHFTIE